MTDHVHPKPFRTWIAIDVAKDFNAVVIQSEDMAKKSFKMANSKSDHDKLIALASSSPQPCCFGLEATGNYHRTLANRILREGFELKLISSLAACRFREALHNSWDKNDPKDAAVILEMLKQDLTQKFVDPLIAGWHDLQEISKTYANLTLMKTRLQHSILNHYLPLYFPEIRPYWHSSSSQWFIRLLQQYPSAHAIKGLSVEEFVAAAWGLLNTKQNKSKILTEIHQLASVTIALPVDLTGPGVATFQLQLRRYLELNRDREFLTELSAQILASNKDYEILLSLPGVGPVHALTILAEAGDLRRFKHYKQFLNYCGFSLSKSQSGLSRGREQLSKRGNSRLRLAFWMAAQTAVRLRENSFREKYRRYVQTDPHNKDLCRKAYTAVAAKIARVAYGLIKHQSEYSGHHELALPSGSIPLCRAVEANLTS